MWHTRHFFSFPDYLLSSSLDALSKGFGWQEGGRERDWIVSSPGQLVPLPSVFNLSPFLPPPLKPVCLHDDKPDEKDRSILSLSLRLLYLLLSFARFRTAELWSIVDFLKEHKRKLSSLLRERPLWSGLRKPARARVHLPKRSVRLLTILLKEHSRALILQRVYKHATTRVQERKLFPYTFITDSEWK